MSRDGSVLGGGATSIDYGVGDKAHGLEQGHEMQCLAKYAWQSSLRGA